MKSFILEYLQEGTIRTSDSVFDCLQYHSIGTAGSSNSGGTGVEGNVHTDAQTELGDLSWFMELFPLSVRMSEIVEAYKLLRDQHS
jgi:hypothetical protein